MINESEKRFIGEVEQASVILKQRVNEGAKLFIISGPSCSTKTTTSYLLMEYLKTNNPDVNFVMIPGDDYFHSNSNIPKIKLPLLDPSGKPYTNPYNPKENFDFNTFNYETPFAAKFDKLNILLKDLLSKGEGIHEKFSFIDGKSIDKTKLKIDKNSVLILDFLHGMYPPITKGINPSQIVTVHTEATSYLYDNEGNKLLDASFRLIRRSLRDFFRRNTDVLVNFGHFGLVEERGVAYIKSICNYADAAVNGGFPYDIPVCASFLRSFYKNPDSWKKKIPHLYKNVKKENLETAIINAKKLIRNVPDFLTDYLPNGEHIRYTPLMQVSYQIVEDMLKVANACNIPGLTADVYDKEIPKNSGIREFIGGLCFSISHE